MGLPKGEMCARTEVTKFVIKYIKQHNLQNTNDRRIIEPNEELQKLLQVPKDEELTYFTIQKYMNKHFKKKLK
jgi:chromatin remodeling complex protein RSC6